MGWGRLFLLGDFGQQLDLQEQQVTLSRMRRLMASKAGKDYDQDEQIQALWQENVELKFCLGWLVNTLASRGVLNAADVAQLVERLEPPPPDDGLEGGPQAQGEGQTDPPVHGGHAEHTSPDLAALGEAARRVRSE